MPSPEINLAGHLAFAGGPDETLYGTSRSGGAAGSGQCGYGPDYPQAVLEEDRAHRVWAVCVLRLGGGRVACGVGGGGGGSSVLGFCSLFCLRFSSQKTAQKMDSLPCG